MKANIIWKEGMAFDAHLGGYNLTIDAAKEFGGMGLGPSPKGLLLISLAGCTGMDVISILQKMRVKPDSFAIATDSILAADHPKKYLEISINYIFKGTNLPVDKIKQAIKLSIDAYCGVYATLSPAVKLSHQIVINDQIVTE